MFDQTSGGATPELTLGSSQALTLVALAFATARSRCVSTCGTESPILIVASKVLTIEESESRYILAAVSYRELD